MQGSGIVPGAPCVLPGARGPARRPRLARAVRVDCADPPAKDTHARLLRARWWDWPVELITEHARTIMAGTPAEVERVTVAHGLC